MNKKTLSKLLADAIIRPAYIIPTSCSELVTLRDLELAESRQKKDQAIEKECKLKRQQELERIKKYGPDNHPELFEGF